MLEIAGQRLEEGAVAAYVEAVCLLARRLKRLHARRGAWVPPLIAHEYPKLLALTEDLLGPLVAADTGP
jgi:hypothetical protein